MAYIEIIQHAEAEGQLMKIYNDLVKKRGKLAAVHKIQSLNPETIVLHMDLYMGIMFGQSPLKRYQREMLAVVVSAVNRCEYCVIHHSEALNHFWKDDYKVQLLAQDHLSLGLDEKDQALCRYAGNLTQRPWDSDQHAIDKLKEAGFSDREILDATLVIAYFNFVNRMVQGLGVELEADGGKGYNYD